ncbi:hypothetical protein Anapl_00018 [Anas platyrhynchos]|uniref:Uncharacterized protein n=1 Tax=Anas platyrhynchos TaxID=8839 RepID=R0K1C1_ANAPL|nr:hypothetical protein Anapl_00018 [Anas platyrhynchos]
MHWGDVCCNADRTGSLQRWVAGNRKKHHCCFKRRADVKLVGEKKQHNTTIECALRGLLDMSSCCTTNVKRGRDASRDPGSSRCGPVFDVGRHIFFSAAVQSVVSTDRCIPEGNSTQEHLLESFLCTDAELNCSSSVIEITKAAQKQGVRKKEVY